MSLSLDRWLILITLNRLSLFLSSLLCFCLLCKHGNLLAAQVPPANAVVSPTPVSTSLPQYLHLSDALNAIPLDRKGKWVIDVKAGTYQESVVINHDNLNIRGAGREHTTFVFTRYAGQKTTPHSNETYGTGRTATVEITSDNVTLSQLTVANGFDFPANEVRSKNDPNRVTGTQAVALKVAESADQTFLDEVALLGYQDTLYVKGHRTLMKGGVVAGHIDFIFGGGTALFDGVDIVSRKRETGHDITGYITAPSTLHTRPFGLVFLNCSLSREAGVPNSSVALGRPWHPTTTFSDGRYASPFAEGHSVFINTFMDAHISPLGWTSMSGKAKDGSKMSFSPLTDARFAEYNSTGPGAHDTSSRPSLSALEAPFYTKAAILMQWQPK